LPQDFLPLDTAICSYGKLELKPFSTHNSYRWSCGGTTPAITISQAGLYWLEVLDRNNCKGRDSIVVAPKQCMSGFYIPTAFTPNGDGKNEVFRPMLFGNVMQYRFTIYNRWGQIVFYTTDTNKGWNGKVAGIPQDANVFVWTCTYQFGEQTVQMEKGTVTVIK
jgi:gliding motility-associated-like protein